MLYSVTTKYPNIGFHFEFARKAQKEKQKKERKMKGRENVPASIAKNNI